MAMKMWERRSVLSSVSMGLQPAKAHEKWGLTVGQVANLPYDGINDLGRAFWKGDGLSHVTGDSECFSTERYFFRVARRYRSFTVAAQLEAFGLGFWRSLQ